MSLLTIIGPCILMFFISLQGINAASTIKIRPEACTNALGQRGTCMFVWQCIKQDGVQLGPCVDGFLVGACCSLPNNLEDNLVPGASGNSSASGPVKTTPTKMPPNKIKPAASTIHVTAVTRPTLAMTTAPVTVSFVGVTAEMPSPMASSLVAQEVTVDVQVTRRPAVADFSECGIPSPQPKMKVVGGTDAHFGEWPWQVSVRRSSFFGFASTHRCGGAILNANWIATAGHCVDDLIKTHIRIRVGDFDFTTTQEPYPFQERGVERKVVHPRYNFFTYEYDLALVKLDSPLVLQPHVKPICLPGGEQEFVGRNATVTGWGRLSEGGALPAKLQQVQVPIISNEKCKDMFQAAGRHESLPDIFLCAGYEAGGRDSCQGDSGGPLQSKGEDGKWFLAGIISWGIGCAEPNMPGVCTRITKFTDWIRHVIS